MTILPNKHTSKIVFLVFLGLVTGSGLVLNLAQSEDQKLLTCPEECEDKRQACEQDCSQLVGGGAKSKERRECKRECGTELESCNYRCLHPTPKPTLKPEAYHDKACTRACELKLMDCNEVCTKFTGGGAKSGKKAACRDDCAESADYCAQRCADPSLPERTHVFDKPELSCREDCDFKLDHCRAGCSVYVGGGAKSEKRARCVDQCEERHVECSGACEE